MNAISNPEDHAKALDRLEELMLADPASGSREALELEELALKIDAFERRYIKIPKPTTEEKRVFWVEQAQQKSHSSEPT